MITAIVLLGVFCVALLAYIFALLPAWDRHIAQVSGIVDELRKAIAELKEQAYVQSQSTVNIVRALTERPASYTLMVKARGAHFGGGRHTCEFGRIGTLKPGETRIESFIPDLELPRGGSFVLIAPDDIYVARVYTGNETYTMGSSQLRRGRFTKCGIANRVQFLIERRAST